GLWENVVFEYPARIPYLDVLVHLNAAKGVFILGSTEPHYTPSKVYQAVLSGKPIWAVLHKSSTACEVIRASGAGVVLDFDGEEGLHIITECFADNFREYKGFLNDYDPKKIKEAELEKFSAYNVTGSLAKLLDIASGTP
ncbi:MAG: hypothetical protein M3040_03385, partial [Bacteroidota bacterium]|nr:hypothetical protein [Bacteroidota bacterium]